MSTFILGRAIGCLVGLAVGDALGVPLEFSSRDSVPKVTEMIGGGPFDLPPGYWTDDTSMALCLADSLLSIGDYDPHDIMGRFVRWFRHGNRSSTGTCFDIGNTTRAALTAYDRTGQLSVECNGNAAGNGSLMRLAPIPIFYYRDLAKAEMIAYQHSFLTHDAAEAADLCAVTARICVEAMHGCSREQVLDGVALNIRGRARPLIKSTGYVVDTFEAAIWAIVTTSSFEEALIAAVNLADDSDTVGAVTGQVAGAIYGYEAIPRRWLGKLHAHDELVDLARRLSEAH